MKSLVWLLALGLSCLLAAGCGKAAQTKQAILRVFKADTELSLKRESLPADASTTQVAQAIEQYCTELERLDMSDCPADFRVAYVQHIRAWRETRAAVEQLPSGFLTGFFMGAVNSLLRGEIDGGQGRMEGALKGALERVRITWEEVERVGAKYGAVLGADDSARP